MVEQELERIEHTPGQVLGSLGSAAFFDGRLPEVSQCHFSLGCFGKTVEERQVQFLDHIIIIGRFADQFCNSSTGMSNLFLDSCLVVGEFERREYR